MSMKQETKPYARWSNRCKAYKMMTDILTSSDYDPNTQPKDLWESNPEFKKYALASFRSAFNRKKADLGVHVRTEGKSG